MLPLRDAFAKGLVRREAPPRRTLVRQRALSDALAQGLVDSRTGSVVDRRSGEKVPLEEALRRGLVRGDLREVVDAASDDKMTVEEAVARGVLRDGKYMHAVSGEKLPLREAGRRGLLAKPMTLKDAKDLAALDDAGRILSPTHRDKLSILASCARGVLDADSLRSVASSASSDNEELLTLAEALADGVILPEGKYRDAVSGEEMTIGEAVDNGLISSVAVRSVFDIEAFQDATSDAAEPAFISLNTALDKQLVTPDEALVVDAKAGKCVPIAEAVQQGLVRPAVLAELNKDIGIPAEAGDAQGGALSVLQAVVAERLDPKAGQVLDPKTKKAVFSDEAVRRELITPQGAALLDSLLNIDVTTQTVTKHVKHFVTVVATGPANTAEAVPAAEAEGATYEVPTDGWYLAEAIDKKLFDPVTGLFIVPGTDRLVSLEECVKLEIINPVSAQVMDPKDNKGQRRLPLLRALGKGLLDATGHYPDAEGSKRITMKEAIARHAVILEQRTASDSPNTKVIKVTKVSGKPDVVEVEVSQPVEAGGSPTFVEVKSSDALGQGAEGPGPLQVQPGVIFDPTSALVICTDGDEAPGRAVGLLQAVKEKKLEPRMVKVKDPYSGKEMNINEAMRKGIIDKATGDYKDRAGRRIPLAEAAKFGMVAVLGAPLALMKKLIVDPRTGEQVSVERALAEGLVDEAKLRDLERALETADAGDGEVLSTRVETTTVVKVLDPATGQELPPDVAVQMGVIDKRELARLTAAAGSLSAPGTPTRSRTPTTPLPPSDDEGLSEAERTRARVTTEPKYQVSLGRARTLSPDMMDAAKPVVLQKMRKRVVKPRDALDCGMIDQDTARILEDPNTFRGQQGEPVNLAEAIALKRVDGNRGAIRDPQRGDLLTIKEAIERGILDSTTPSGNLLVPVARSLSVPGLVEQGLLEPEAGRVVHPETGALLTLSEAMTCEIVDPLSQLADPLTGKRVTLREALDSGSIDDETATVATRKGSVDLLTAARDLQVFEKAKPVLGLGETLPPTGMTFPVAVTRGLVDAAAKEVIHPITGVRTPVQVAIHDDFIMALPYPVSPDSVEVTQALDCNLIDTDKATFTNPRTGDVLPVSEAVETGLLVIKPVPSLLSFEAGGVVTAVTETVTSYQTITTRTIDLKPGFVLISADEVKNAQTGEVMSLDQARLRGIARDESEEREEYTTVDSKTSFEEAVAQGLVDLHAGTFTHPESGEVMAIRDAISSGLLDTSAEPEPEPEAGATRRVSVAEMQFDEKEKKFRDPTSPDKAFDTLREAMEAGVVDPEAVVYDVASGRPVTTREAVDSGMIDAAGRVTDPSTGTSMSVKDAAKLGLLAVVGAPVLAGMAVADKLKSMYDKKKGGEPAVTPPARKSKSKSPSPSPAVAVAAAAAQSEPQPRQVARQLFPEDKDEETDSTDSKTAALAKPVVVEALLKSESATPVTKSSHESSPSVAEITIQSTAKPVKGEPSSPTTKQPLDAQALVAAGALDAEKGQFLNPQSGDVVPFHEFALRLGILDPERVVVRDLAGREDTFVPLRQALQIPLLDKNTGQMVDPSTGKRVPFLEAVKLGWIVERPPEKTGRELVLSLEDAVEQRLFSPDTAEVLNPATGELMPLAAALSQGVLSSEAIMVRSPDGDDVITLSEAVESGMVDLDKGTVVDPRTGQAVDMKAALASGLLMASPRKALSLEAVINKGLYDADSGLITNPATEQAVPVDEAVRQGVVDAFLTECKDSRSGAFVSLDDALQSKIINAHSGRFRDTESGQIMPLDEALAQGLISTNHITLPLVDTIVEGFYSPRSGRVLNPGTGLEQTLAQAMDCGFVDAASARVRDDHTERIVTVAEAVQSGLLDADKGLVTYPAPMALDDALERGYILATGKPCSLQAALAQGCYEPKTGLMLLNDDRVTLEEAVKQGEINRNALTVKDPRSGDILTLAEAVKVGVINPKHGTATDPTSGAEMHFYDALERGLIVPAKRKISLSEAVFKGFYDPKSGKFTSPETKERLPTDRAIKRGMIDPESTLVRTEDGVVPFLHAIETGLVDARAGTLVGGPGVGTMDFHEAFEKGLLVEVRRPMPLSEALAKGVFDADSARFMNPSSGEGLTLADAVDQYVVESDSVHVKDTRSGFLKKQSLAEAMRIGLVDGETSKVRDFSRGADAVVEVALPEAVEQGLIVDSKSAVSVQRAIHQGLYHDDTGKLTDPNTGRKVTLHEAIRRYIINPELPCYWDRKSERLLSLVETCRAGIIDRRAGRFKEPGSNCAVPLSEAMELGLIVDIETAGFGLFEALAMGLYDPATGLLAHPATGRRLTLADSVKEELVSPLLSIVKHAGTGRYMKLDEAVKAGLVDDEAGVYRLPDSARTLSLAEAKQKGLIVTARRPLSVEEAVRCGLYRVDSGRFVDPESGDALDIAQALARGLLQPDTTAVRDPITGQLKSLNSALEDGTIDAARGRVTDPKTREQLNVEAALDRGLLVTTDKPLTFKEAVRRGSIDFKRGTFKDPRSMLECTLEEAIRHELIDPESAMVKDPATGRFHPLKKAIVDGLIDLNKRAALDPNTGKAKSLCIMFEQGTVVFLREPLTFEAAVEQGHLDTATAKFTDPTSKEQMTLREAVTQGLIDPDSALIKDTRRKHLLKLAEAFRKGLMEGEKGNVLDSESSRLNTLAEAIDTGLLTSPRRGFTLIEAVQYGLYDPASGAVADPYLSPTHAPLTLAEAVEAGLVDPSSTAVKDPETGAVCSLPEAMSSKLVDSAAGRLRVPEGEPMDLAKALQRGYILPAEQRQAMEEKYRLCDESLQKLLQWIAEVEDRLANQDVVHEQVDELRNQINNLKVMKDDLDAHARPVSACLDQVRLIVSTGGELLSSVEMASLEKNGKGLRTRYDRALNRTDLLLRRLAAARDELTKFRGEMTQFVSWLDKARRVLEDKERSLSNLNRLTSGADSTREFVSDVIAHQADLRFITMAAQKFVDESKEYLTVLNDFRTSLPQRLPHVEAISAQDSVVRNEVSVVTAQYKDLLNRCNALTDRLSGVGGRQREYRDAVDKARAWLKEVEPRAHKIIAEPIGADPKTVEDQLHRAKQLNSEFVANARLIDNARQALAALLRSLDGQLTPAEARDLEQPVVEIEAKYNQLAEALADKCAALDTALTQSQGVQDALDGLVGWLNSSDNQLKTQWRPASLIKERLEEQIREHRQLQAEIDSHKASVEAVARSAQELVNTASNSRLAKKIETKLHDVTSRFDKLLDKVAKRGEFLDEVMAALMTFSNQATLLERWLSEMLEVLDSRELPEVAARLEDLAAKRDAKREPFEEAIRNGRNLVGQKDVTDTGPVRDRIKGLESQWKELNGLLDEKTRLSRARAEQLSAYDRLRDQVMEWLSNMENRLARLEAIALDAEYLKKQSEEIKPLVKEHRDYAGIIDKVNDLGNAYDALTQGGRPDSPARRRSGAYSPTKRLSSTASPIGRRSSQDALLTSPVSPGGSSGFGSRRSSQDGGFHLDEVSPVQQQLTEINNRYSLLGVRLGDRQTELDQVREEVRKILENLRTLSVFLDKVQRALPKESVPMTKDEADKMTRQIKSVLEEMYEKQSLLDGTRGSVQELLRRKPGARGADTLHDEMAEVASRWRALHDLCKARIKLMEDMKDFHDTHDSLSGWLAAKDRMLTVLGPISSDPRMVQSQVQQVQVLREEFRTQQPQLNHLLEVGDAVLAHVDRNSGDGQRIAAKLDQIQQRWNDLLGRLEERAESLGAAADTSREFDAQLTRLRDALQAISDALDDLPLDKDPEEQLRKIENLERQLEGQRPLLADVEAAGAQLCEVLTDPASRADIQAKLAAVIRQYNTLQKKLDHRKAEIEGSLRDGRQFEQSCARTLGWLSDELGGLSERLLVSADRDVLQEQLDKHEPVYKAVLNREHEVIMLLNKGRDMQARAGPRGDARNLGRDLDKIQQAWDRLRKDVLERHTRLQTCMEHCRKYYRAQEQFLPWLLQAEDKLESLQPASFKRKDIERQLKELAAFRNDVWKRSGEYENNRMLGETFVGSCDIDKDIVKNELTNMKQRWDRLNNGLLERTQALEETARRLGDFGENLRDLAHAVQRCEDKLASHDAIGGAARDPKMLERIRALREEAGNLKKPLLGLRQAAGDLVKEAGEHGVDAHHLQDEVEGVGDRIDELCAKLDDRCSQLQSAATAVSQFNEQVKALGQDLTGLENELDAMKPPGREIKVVRAQLEDVSRFLKKVSRAADDVARAVQSGEHLVDSGFASDTVATRDQVESLRRQLARLEERGRNREEDLDAALGRLESFYQQYAVVMEDINHAAEQVRKLKPIGSDLDSIKAQQEEFRHFRRATIEPLGATVGDTNRAGQGLVQSAAGGVSTAVLEKDLEKLNDRWNDLKEKMNERDRRLDVGLLQSGKFQEALDGLSKWLSETEEMVAKQKPPSADYKVVKAQLQEQKFLKKMLLDRQNSMSSLFAMGNEVAANADPAERKAIERQLKDLMGRFDRLTEGAQQRMEALEMAMAVAKQFQDKLVPIMEWLDKTERKVKDLELVPTDEEKIQQKIREHDALHKEILRKKAAFTELTEVASTLMELVGEDEAAGLADKLTETTDRYATLVEASEAVGALLQQSRQGLRHLVLTYQDLQAWMEKMEKELNRHRVLAVHTDKLLQQMDDLADLTEEIANKQTQVDGTVDSGLELMKHISNDEAIQLKDKLDSLQRRYNDLTSRGADLLKHAQEALPLVQQFHNCHTKLVDWMMGAEATLQQAEPREEDIHRLELDIQEFRPVLEAINQVGPRLCQMSPGEGASTIEGLMTRDNRRFDAIAEQIQRKAERIQLSKQRSLEVISDIDELLDWFREVENQIREAEPPSSDPDVIRVQLKEHKALNDDISSQKGRVRDVLSTAKKVLRESAQQEDTGTIREKMEDLREMMELVSGLSADRLGILEQALPLAQHFLETHATLASWLTDMERQVAMLAMPSLRPDLIAQQQDRNEMFLQSLNEHKPLLDKLNKTGEALISLVNDEEGSKVQDVMDGDNARYNALRVDLRTRQQALEKALQESSQFADKLEGMLRALTNTADQVNNMEPVSAHPPKIRDQIDDNNAIVEDLDKRQEAYDAVKRAATDVINKAGNRADPAVNDIKRKLEKLNSLWNDVQKATGDRGKSLDEALRVAQKFWEQLHAVMATLRDLQDTLQSQDPPAVEPSVIKQQQHALQDIRHDIDQTKPEVDQVRQTGQKLMKICGEPDKPEVKKNIEDLDSAWDNITALYARREENLIDAMEKAMEFHEMLQNLLAFLDKAEDKFAHMGALGSDIDAVKRQISQLKDFKHEVDPHMVKVEALNRQAQELTERTSADQAAAIKEPLNAVNRRWDDLLRGMVERQRQLENALLRLGQFQHALSELLAWIDATERTLDSDLKPVPGDPQLLEVELAKLKVLVNDIQAHQSSVDTLNDAGRQLIESGKGTLEASSTQEKLSTLNRRWRELLQKAADRQTELEDALREAQRYHAEVQDLLSWLGEVDGVIAASKPVGGLPETASEQLQRFMEVYNELEENRPKVESCLAQGHEYLKKSSERRASNLEHNLRTLKQRWDSVTARANDKKIKLEIALKEATEFHDALQAFVDWLTNAEKVLSNLKPVSRVMETILQQIEEHKAFQKDVGVHRETMLNLDKKGTHLKYFSQKQDVILIKNLLISVQHRWERVVSKSAERTRALDHGYKEAREFHDAWSGLMSWLTDTEKGLEELQVEEGVGNDPDRIKQRLAKHREFQRALSGKQATYDATMRAGKTLKDRAPKTDETALRNMLTQLKNKWTAVCAMSVERQRRLEEALLYCGQFKDAVQALMDWLYKMDKILAEDGPVHGDLDTVMALVEQHKQFEEDLSSRSAQMESVKRTGKDLMDKATAADAAAIRSQLSELTSMWDKVSRLSDRKTKRLEDALKEAEALHKAVHMLLEWLSDAEMKLRFSGTLPEDEHETRAQLAEHEKFMREMREKEREKDQTIALAQRILAKAHPDGATVIKHWITIIQSRWEEVSSWAKQREQRLNDHLRSLRDLDSLLEELLSWLQGLESNLLSLEAEPLPDDLNTLRQLIQEHQEFMENTAVRQGEVDAVCKSRQVAKGPAAKDKDRRPSKPRTSLSSRDLERESSPEYEMSGRKGSRASPGREKTPDIYPHIGPRFPPKGSKGAEPQFRSPRVKLLWDKWRNVWMLSWERQRRLQEKYNYLLEMERVKNFSWDDWRRRFLKFMNHKKSRLTDLFRKMDKNNDGLIPREDFIDGIIKTKFDTSRLEMNAVADMFDHNNEGLIDWKEFIAALRPDWEEKQPSVEADKIHDEVKRLVMLCTCRQKFRVFQVGEGKYRFGDSQKLRLVRILRSTVMVRVGGGWVALDEFLVKNDPCRAKGRTNIELREQFILADGVSQSMSAFKPKHSSSSSQRSASLSSAGPITKIRERSARSVPMKQSSTGRSSFSAASDSLSDNEGSFSRGPPTRKSSAPLRSSLTPGGSLPGSRNNSRPPSRQGSKPPSRHGSNLSLDSTDEGTPSRIPMRRVTSSTPSSAQRKLTVPMNGSATRPRTPTSGLTSPASGAVSSGSRIPIYVGASLDTQDEHLPASSFSCPTSGARTPSGSSTPAPPGLGTKLTRRASGASDTSTGARKGKTSPAPFHL
ncbi:dystonin isoform X6 [Thrips palmi]|uniref:Dystonin isoform X6 n=1 Tax=Thrips palmi TaxID=161013 RepID=A0A6P8ZWA4_THRPL|nr:dystonin isoform X6 [Thrips palmi]